ncbi:MAG TPA: DoxX family protein [Prolixibacteraceae bacterium]|nr:DoxX family protein [Prolixibacteraceae bacterium]
MEIFLTISSIIVAIVFILAGVLKLIYSQGKHQADAGNSYFKSTEAIRILSITEIVIAILFVVPYEINFLPFISHISAFLLMIIMIGAPISHIKLGEHLEASLTTLLLIIILVITFNRIFD